MNELRSHEENVIYFWDRLMAGLRNIGYIISADDMAQFAEEIRACEGRLQMHHRVLQLRHEYISSHPINNSNAPSDELRRLVAIQQEAIATGRFIGSEAWVEQLDNVFEETSNNNNQAQPPSDPPPRPDRGMGINAIINSSAENLAREWTPIERNTEEPNNMMIDRLANDSLTPSSNRNWFAWDTGISKEPEEQEIAEIICANCGLPGGIYNAISSYFPYCNACQRLYRNSQQNPFFCEICGKFFPRDNRRGIEGKIICDNCVETYSADCPECNYEGEIHHIDDSTRGLIVNMQRQPDGSYLCYRHAIKKLLSKGPSISDSGYICMSCGAEYLTDVVPVQAEAGANGRTDLDINLSDLDTNSIASFMYDNLPSLKKYFCPKCLALMQVDTWGVSKCELCIDCLSIHNGRYKTCYTCMLKDKKKLICATIVCANCDEPQRKPGKYVFINGFLYCQRCANLVPVPDERSAIQPLGETRSNIICAICGHFDSHITATHVLFLGNPITNICEDCRSDIETVCLCGTYIPRIREFYFDGDYLCPNCTKNAHRCACGARYRTTNILNLCNRCLENKENTLLHEYHYKPNFIFYRCDNERTNELLGFELEVEMPSRTTHSLGQIDRILAMVKVYERPELYVKYDGSLNYGFEIVSNPCSIRYHLEHPYDKLLHKLSLMGCQSHDSDTCGLHVHVSRNYLSETDITKLVAFVSLNHDRITKVARRNGNEYTVYYSDDKIKSRIRSASREKRLSHGPFIPYCEERHEAVNLFNNDTIEFRMFRGTLNPQTLLGTLCFVHGLIKTVKKISINAIMNHDDHEWSSLMENMKAGLYKPARLMCKRLM